MPVTLLCVICDSPFTVRPSRVAKGAKYCSYHCHQIGEGRKGGRTTGQQNKAKSTGKSYIKLNGRHLHRQVAERMLGRPLWKGEIVHHLDGNKHNNAEGNLFVTTQSEHIREHYPEMLRRRKAKKLLDRIVAYLQDQRVKKAGRTATSEANRAHAIADSTPSDGLENFPFKDAAHGAAIDRPNVLFEAEAPMPVDRREFVFTAPVPPGAKPAANEEIVIAFLLMERSVRERNA